MCSSLWRLSDFKLVAEANRHNSIGCYPQKLTLPVSNVSLLQTLTVLEQSGKIVGAKIAQGIVDTGYYKLFERDKLSRILEERKFNQSDVVAPATAAQLKLVGVDALIFGVVDAYNIDDQTGVSKIEKRIGTGEYRTVEKEGEDGTVEQAQEEIMKTVLIDRGYIIREGTLGVTFRMANISTGEIVAVETATAGFSQKT